MNQLEDSHIYASNLIFTPESFGILRKRLIQNLGNEKAKRFLLRFGKDLGTQKATELLMNHYPMDQMLKLAPEVHITLGHVTDVTITGSTMPSKDGTSDFQSVTGIWHGSFEVDAQLRYVGPANDCTCYTLSGFASGFLSVIHHQDIFVYEETCRSKGDPHCRFKINTKEYWLEQGIEFIGPGKHGITQAMYIYVIDPGSGARLEIFTGGYLIFDPDWEPIEWTEEEGKIGNTFWGDSINGNPAIQPTIKA